MIIKTSTVRSQKMSKIPPKTVGSLNRAMIPSNVSIKNEIPVKIDANIIKKSSN